ncbi:hypothetical protein C1645_807770 [Glomus cerebriforme]|uniref:Protein kinase domain-containing protein n=1 Tax=Glomus cerebriforme TaxID=658196 RepID=A0A397SLF7_9GLOM|nr:hypothetical protein C1645_807770 [Glomus cerebriforme]
MSDKSKLQFDKNPNKWIEEAISKNHIKYYDYKCFTNIKKIKNNSFEKFYRANWKNSEQCFALKSFLNFDDVTVKEILFELELQHKIDFYNNIIRLYGITAKESKNDQLKKYLLVMEYVDGNSLQSYLKETFKNLTWEDKYKLAYQLTCIVSHLHDKGIVLGDLHSSNILVYQNTIKLTDLGLTKRIKELSEQKSSLLDIVPYIDPKKFVNSDDLVQPYSLNKKSDVYSIGMLLWEISSGQPPFKNKSFDADLITQILQEIYNWLLNNQDNSSNSIYLLGYLNFHGIGTNVNRQEAIKLYQKAVELENNAAKLDISYIYIYGNDDETNYNKAFEISKKLAEEEYPGGINRLGYCYDSGIGTEVNIQKAFELYQKAADLGNSNGINNLGWCYEKGIGTDVNMQKAFEFYQKAADLENLNGINNLGACYDCGTGTNINKQKAFELYLTAANLENDLAQYNLALMYENGNGIEKNINQAIYWYKKLLNKEMKMLKIN